MPAALIKSFADKTGKSEAEIEKLWNKAKSLSSEKFSEIDEPDKFFAYTTGILKKMLSINEENTGADSYPPSERYMQPMHLGYPVFNVDDNIFWNLHLQARKNGQWFDSYYIDTDIANWARQNKGKDFYLKHTSLGILRKVKAS